MPCAPWGCSWWPTTGVCSAPPARYGIPVAGVAAVAFPGCVTPVPRLGRPTNYAPGKRRVLLLPPPFPIFYQTPPVPVLPVLAQRLFTPARAWLRPPPRCVARPSLPPRPLATAPLLRSTPQPALRRGRPWRHRHRHLRHCRYPRRHASAQRRGPATGARSGPSRPTLQRRRAVRGGLRPSQHGARDEASRQPVTGLRPVTAHPSVAARRHRHCQRR